MTMGSPQQDPIQPALGWDGLRWVGLIFGPHPMMIPTWPGGRRVGPNLQFLQYLQFLHSYLSHCLARKGLAVFNRYAHSAGPGPHRKTPYHPPPQNGKNFDPP